MHAIARVGLFGIAVFLATNAVAVFEIEKSAAQPFSSVWWSQWFPALAPFLVLFITGAALSWFQRRSV